MRSYSFSALFALVVTAGTLLLAAPPLADTTAPDGGPAVAEASPASAPPAVLDPATLEAQVKDGIVMIDSQTPSAQTAGTGVVLSPDGLVLTNHHVVSGGRTISATHQGTGARYPVDVLGYDRTRDIAVVRLRDAQNMPTLSLGPDAALQGGESVTAVGNAEGTGRAATVRGTVIDLDQRIVARSSIDGTVNRLGGLIEVDAPVRPGDSGGPLVTEDGTVVGINTAGNAAADPARPQEGPPRSYAVPVEDALEVLDVVNAGVSTDTVHVGPTPVLGVTVRDTRRGAEVRWVSFDSPADGAGLRIGDVVTTFDGAAVRTSDEMRSRLNLLAPGDAVTLGWIDEAGASRTARLTLAEGPPN
ncbi:trypsin-like peptidase domain-containing protein [Rhodococcus sp. HNM0569]|uniref:S1C family serine protease n=1 Tax=Rhodococcus sp. HNM0569 TaxID=2716340 RepID=UPI00146AB0C9|nr:trypsin-like peptidase domain-containing protein [Rhodococcus sp. HNM0569]NLU83586.1 trypsin-like serine protease [Rhodococcus sp. HNM0569]